MLLQTGRIRSGEGDQERGLGIALRALPRLDHAEHQVLGDAVRPDNDCVPSPRAGTAEKWGIRPTRSISAPVAKTLNRARRSPGPPWS